MMKKGIYQIRVSNQLISIHGYEVSVQPLGYEKYVSLIVHRPYIDGSPDLIKKDWDVHDKKSCLALGLSDVYKNRNEALEDAKRVLVGHGERRYRLAVAQACIDHNIQ